MEDKRAKILEKVRALLAKADSTGFSGEADSFRAKADELMTAYAIEQWQIDAAQQGVGARPMPVRRDFDFSWWFNNPRYEELWTLFQNVAFHCRCVVAVRAGWHAGKLPVIGLESDMDYFDMLFTHLMLQMGKNLEPKPDPNKSIAENTFVMRSAGLNRGRIARLMWNVSMLDVKPSLLEKYDVDMATPWERLPKSFTDNLCQRLRKELHQYARENGVTVPRTRPQIYQRSYAQGFVQEVGLRMRQMRAAQEGPSQETGSVALAIRDIRQQARDLYDEMFPPPEEKEKKSRALVSDNRRFDSSAYVAGTHDGRKAEISGHPSKGVGGSRRQLGGG